MKITLNYGQCVVLGDLLLAEVVSKNSLQITSKINLSIMENMEDSLVKMRAKSNDQEKSMCRYASLPATQMLPRTHKLSLGVMF